jgi:hypothetical protein
MDVEGAEPLVVTGAEHLLRNDRPLILSELHPTQLDRASGVSADAFLAQMHALGYRAHTLRRGGAKAEGEGYEELLGPALDRAPADALVSIALIPL